MQEGNIPNKHVFISYSHQDLAFVTHLQNDLISHGITIWLDHENLKPGTYDWEAAVRKGIMHSQAIIYLASPNAIQSTYVKDELNIARDAHVPVLPFWIMGMRWSDVAPIGWGMMQYIDARQGKYLIALNQLLSSLIKPHREEPIQYNDITGNFQPISKKESHYTSLHYPIALNTSSYPLASKLFISVSSVLFILASFIPWFSIDFYDEITHTYKNTTTINLYGSLIGLGILCFITNILILVLIWSRFRVSRYTIMVLACVQLISVTFTFFYTLNLYRNEFVSYVVISYDSGFFIAFFATLLAFIIGSPFWSAKLREWTSSSKK